MADETLPKAPKYEKRPGHDWTVVFRDPDDNALISCAIFGCNTAEQVAEQAHADAGMPLDSDILLIVRSDAETEVFRHLRTDAPGGGR